MGEYLICGRLNDNSSILISSRENDQASLFAWNWLFTKHMHLCTPLPTNKIDRFLFVWHNCFVVTSL